MRGWEVFNENSHNENNLLILKFKVSNECVRLFETKDNRYSKRS